jgi:LPS export ABC transporter permease LptG/LPS export ABC transporter permease LptF
MFRTIDRYVIRESLTPFLLALAVLTFVLEIPPIIDQGEQLIAKGASVVVVSKVLLTLVPQALGITIPMSLLIGLLMALGRLSSDREVVALQACGVSLARLLRPVGTLAVAACAATMYVMIVAVPAANQAFRELTYQVISSITESQIRPHVFFQQFPNLVVYVGDATPEGAWGNVFVADTGRMDSPRIYTATRGELRIDNVKRQVQIVLTDGQSHVISSQEPEKYETTKFERSALTLDPSTIFPREGPLKGDREMTIAELQQRIAEMDRQRAQAHRTGASDAPFSTHNQIMAIQQKFSIPIACLVFAIIALPLGVTTRKDGKLASFVLGGAVVYLYYIVMYVGQSLAKGGQVSPVLATWLANLLLGLCGLALFVRRLSGTERPIRITLPFRSRAPAAAGVGPGATATNRSGRVVLVVRVPHFSMPGPTILDWYVMRLCGRTILLSGGVLLGLFYIATFIDLSDKLFKGTATGSMILTLLWLNTPQYLYYIIPIAVLIGTLVTIGTITKNSELVVMKACGISLYRLATPLLTLALLASGLLFVLEERVLAYANRRADVIDNAVRGRAPRSADALNRRWLVGRNGSIYHYVYFDRTANQLNSLSVYDFDRERQALTRITFISQATYRGEADGEGTEWEAQRGWVRDILPKPGFASFDVRTTEFESPSYFGSEEPDAELMSYSELNNYVASLQAGGFNVVPYLVSLHRKIAFPFVTLVMALIAVPFAVTTGRRGALYGIGAGIALAIVYWTTISVFAAIGSAGLIAPLLAAWAPNILFGMAALYLVLTVRT